MNKNLQIANSMKLEFLAGEYTKLNNQWSVRNKSFQFTRLYYIYNGSAVLTYKETTITMTPGNLYLLPAGLPVSYHCPESMEQLFLHVILTTPDGFDILSAIPKVCQIPCTNLQQLIDLYYSGDYGKLMAFKSQVLQDVGACLMAENIPFPAQAYSQEVLQAIAYMQNNITVQLSGEEIAREVFTSPSRLYKRFKAETGLTLGAYLDRLIFHRATLLLADRQLSIKEISQQLGFCDEHYFSRRFKAQMGKTPTRYRKSHLT